MKKRFFYLFAVLLLCVCATSCGSKPSYEDDYKPTKEELRAKAREDSIAKAQEAERKEKAEKMKSEFKYSGDEFGDYVWVDHNSHKSSDKNKVKLYFQQKKEGGKPYNLRFYVCYDAENWLFIKKLIFNIDGTNYTYIPDNIKRDHYTNIWEWFDNPASDAKTIIYAISGATTVKIKFIGSDYHGVRTMSKKDLNAFKKVLHFYSLQGGTL